MKLSCVILTMGDRPAELARAIGSAVAQQGDGLEVVVVGNGADVPPGRHRVSRWSNFRKILVWQGAATQGWTRAAATWCSSSTTTAGSPIPSWERMSPDVLPLILVLP